VKKRVVVTGANGFIGRYVVNALLKERYEVIAIVHSAIHEHKNEVTYVKADISVKKDIQNACDLIKNCDVFVHIAANINFNDKEGLINTNCLGTYFVSYMAKQLQAEKIVYLSSIPVIGVPQILPINEEHPINPISLYHRTKHFGEEVLMQECGKDMSVVILRIPSPIGVGMSECNFLSYLIHNMLQHKTIQIYGKGQRLQNYIDVRDIARAVVKGIEINEEGLFLIASPDGITNIELAKLCKKVVGSGSEIITGVGIDKEEHFRWDINTQKAKDRLDFVTRYSIEETVFWICESIKDV